MWSKRPKPGQKGIRCTVQVKRDGEQVNCDRPAKRFRHEQPEVAHWVQPLKPEAVEVNCCIGHLRKLIEEGARLERIDMRKRR